MKIKQYDRVLLKNGCTAYIVEIFVEEKFFLADIDKNGDTYTEEVTIEEIERIYTITPKHTVKYCGKSSISLTKGKIYDVISVENGWYRIIDDTGEDYLFAPENFTVVDN